MTTSMLPALKGRDTQGVVQLSTAGKTPAYASVSALPKNSSGAAASPDKFADFNKWANAIMDIGQKGAGIYNTVKTGIDARNANKQGAGGGSQAGPGTPIGLPYLPETAAPKTGNQTLYIAAGAGALVIALIVIVLLRK